MSNAKVSPYSRGKTVFHSPHTARGHACHAGKKRGQPSFEDHPIAFARSYGFNLAFLATDARKTLHFFVMSQPALNVQSKKKCTVYVDGFNMYWGLMRSLEALKWLDLQSFFERLRPDDEVTSIKYFTALVEPNALSSATRNRQQVYLAALKTRPKIRVIYGRYQEREVQCRECYKRYRTPEEKKTDVNIAVHILNDAIKAHVERVVLVSGDSDIEPAIVWVKDNKPEIKCEVYVPAVPDEKSTRRNDFYRSIGVSCRYLPTDYMHLCQLQNPVVGNQGALYPRPPSWG